MAKAIPRSDLGAQVNALGDFTNENKQKQELSSSENAETESNVESETEDRSVSRDSNNSYAPVYSDSNGNVRINRNESESDASNVINVTENGIPINVGNDRFTNDSKQCFNCDEDGESRKSKRRSYKDSTEALELALMQLGPFGVYQRYVVLMLCIPNMLAAMYSLNYVFVADPIPFRMQARDGFSLSEGLILENIKVDPAGKKIKTTRKIIVTCIVPECEGEGASFSNASVRELLAADRCRRYAPLQPGRRTCARGDFHPNETVTCNAFMYENMDTAYAEFDMACAEWRRTLVGTVRNAALPLALLLTGYIADGWGRRTAFCILSCCAGALGIVKSLMPHYRAYLALEFLEAALGYGFNSAAYVMMVELARPSLRVAFASATGVGYGLGGVLFALVARRVYADASYLD